MLRSVKLLLGAALIGAAVAFEEESVNVRVDKGDGTFNEHAFKLSDRMPVFGTAKYPDGKQRAMPTFTKKEQEKEFHWEVLRETFERMTVEPTGNGVEGRRIVDGSYADEGEIPYQLFMVDQLNGYSCGAVLMESNKVLTAAHCVVAVANSPGQAIFFGGDLNRDFRYYSIGVDWQSSVAQEIIYHPQYDAATIRNDVAVVLLKDEFTLGGTLGTITPATTSASNGDVVQISGWGSVMRRSPGSSSSGAFDFDPRLRMSEQDILDPDNCADWYNVNVYGSNVMDASDFAGVLCVMPTSCDYYTGNGYIYITGECPGFCQGDSGGPVVTNAGSSSKRNVGVVSYTIGCGLPLPDGVTDIGYYSNWVDTNTVSWPAGQTNSATSLATSLLSLGVVGSVLSLLL